MAVKIMKEKQSYSIHFLTKSKPHQGLGSIPVHNNQDKQNFNLIKLLDPTVNLHKIQRIKHYAISIIQDLYRSKYLAASTNKL